MFTGIVEGIGKIRAIQRRDLNAKFEIEVDFDLDDTNVGDSIAIDGCCLTVTSRLGNHFWADISDETLRVTNLGRLGISDLVNVERALKVGARLGGHLVQGHVDGVGKIVSLQDVKVGKELKIQIPERLRKYIVKKGSITVDGISLTVNSIKQELSIRIIPHTVNSTTFKCRKTGDSVNLEVDIIGKYVEKLALGSHNKDDSEKEITEDLLKKYGF